MALAAAPEVPGFRALSPLGYGPTSTIFSAQSISLGRWVALTVYATTLTDDRAQRRFQRAFETARRLGSHPHAVTLLESGLTLERQPYVASEIYERGTLDGRIANRQPLPVDETLRLGIALAGVLETSHRAGVVHGGVHPGRILLGNDGEPALADLGLVPLVERTGLLGVVGPKYHAPPEVLEGETVTPATDVYSLASMLYMALAGHPPYQGRQADDDTVASLLLRTLQHDVPPLRRPDIPPSLETMLSQALSCDATNRPATAVTLAHALQSCQQELGLPVTEPVLLDVPPAVNLSVATSQVVAPPVPDPSPAPSAPPAPSPSPVSEHPPASSGIASDNGTTPVRRVFVPYQPPESETSPGSEHEAHEPSASEQPMTNSVFTEPPPVEPFVSDDPTYETVRPQAAPPASDDGLDELWARQAAAADDQGDDGLADSDPDADSTSQVSTSSARALPVLVLMSLVAVLIGGVGWMIVTGKDPSQAEGQTTESSASLQDPETVSPSSVTAVENASGVQVDWDGSADGPQVVLVLQAGAGPEAIPVESGTALVVPVAELQPDMGYCFAVTPASDPLPSAAQLAADLPDDGVSSNACIRGATPESVRRS